MHRFLHIGDLHLGPNDRNVDRIAALDQILREGLAQPLSAWLWPGDLNHGRMTIADKNVLAERVQRMANHAPVLICYGNHDLPGDLDFLARLSASYPIIVVSRPEVFNVVTADGFEAAVFVLPYPTRAGLVAAGVSSDLLVDAAYGALDLIFIDASAKLKAARAAGMLTLMIGHVNVAASIVSSGQPNIGREIEIDQALLDRLGSIPKLLNHIHVGQEIAGAWYAGSSCRLDWGETHPKRYLELQVTANPFGHGWAWRVEEHPLDVAPMWHVEGELTRDGFSWTVKDSAHAYPAPPSWDGSEVRVRFRFVAADKPLLNFELVKAPFVGAKRIELDPIAEHTRALRAPEVAAAQTLTEKVEAFVRGAGVTWTANLAEKLTLLQQTEDGALFLTAIENAVTGAVPIDVEIPQEVCQ